ncbi:MAG: HAMP domain-containing sensor histidine kinase [Oscillatoria sp. PMC 1068.18]|nr:HAMP domain-containing sensor histidine kinase [Oscillatoria sp. PMC 1076.18]MEC4988785.1 HAMP domain-containing sensor histidine kinase [Oscillatoria sp. PMC 1068.18]
MNDLEALKEELKQTQLAYYLAAQISEFKAGFLARTSHELRSPLNSLIGLHQLILSDLCDSPEEEREFVAQAHQSALKLLKLLDEIVNVSKIEYGSNPTEVKPVQLLQVFNEVETLMLLPAANRSLRLKITPPTEKLYVLADFRRLQQSLTMLVDTAIAKMDEGSIAISVAPNPTTKTAQIYLDIESPTTIWSEDTNLLQQPVTPVTPELAKNPQEKSLPSPGMKLWLAQSLVELMGGKLEVVPVSPEENSEGFTRLLCSLPVADAAAVTQELAD